MGMNQNYMIFSKSKKFTTWNSSEAEQQFISNLKTPMVDRRERRQITKYTELKMSGLKIKVTTDVSICDCALRKFWFL